MKEEKSLQMEFKHFQSGNVTPAYAGLSTGRMPLRVPAILTEDIKPVFKRDEK